MELLIVLCVITLLATVAVPNFRHVKAYFDVQGNSRQLVSVIAAAKTNAIRQGRFVAVCRRTDYELSQCADRQINSDGDWSIGWLLFVDMDDNQLFNGGDHLIKEGLNTASGCEIFGRGDFLSFNPEGLLRGGGNGTFTVRCDKLEQKLIVNVIGRIRYGGITQVEP